jgi:hypothetical protein
MAALPANNTDRYFFHYASAVHSHTLMVRTAVGVAFATVEGAVEEILTTLTGAFIALVGTGVDFQAKGTDFSVPVSSGDWASFSWGSVTANAEIDAIAFNFQGRSAGGHKCRWGVFGYKNANSAYRLTGGEAAGVEDVVAILNSTTGVFLAIDELAPNWYSYANIKPNDYWVKQAR